VTVQTIRADVAPFTAQAAVDLPSLPAEMAAIVQWANTASAAQTLVTMIVDTPFMPAAFWPKFDPRDQAAADRARQVAIASGTAAVLYGGPLGLNPLQALASIHVVKGKPGLPAELMVALVRSHGHDVGVEDLTDHRCRVWGKRAHSEQVHRAEFTFDRAKKAGYVAQNTKYGTDPQAMLYARAVSILCRQMAPEVLKGLTTLEELHDEGDGSTPVRGPRSVQRVAAGILRPASTPTAPAAASERPQDGPLLPGEDEPRAVEPEPVSDAQMRALGAAFADLGVKGAGERADRLAVTSALVGRPIGSAKELDRGEASLVLDNLRSSGAAIVADVLGRGPADDQPPVPGDVVDQGDADPDTDEPPPLPADPNDHDPTAEAGFGQDGDR
jgi:hypothetical protein